MTMEKTNYWGQSGSSNFGSEPSISFTDVTKGSSGGGTYSWEVSLAFLFWDEMRMYQNAINPPTFTGGIVKEKPSKNKCKVKLAGSNKEVIVDCGYGDNIKKGMYALLLCKKDDVYVIISAKNFAGMADEDSSEYSV